MKNGVPRMIGAACREGWPTLFHRLPQVILRLVSPLGGTLELAEQIAAHESAPTVKLHDRTRGLVSNAAKSEVVHYIQPVLAKNRRMTSEVGISEYPIRMPFTAAVTRGDLLGGHERRSC
jgi:hypothetical protein